MDLFEKCYNYHVVEEAQQQGIYPYFHSLETKQDVEVMMEGQKRIMIGSNNYLGLTGDPRIVDAGVEAVKEYGSGVSGSRFLNGTLNLHIQLEKELAEFLNKDACITFGTGFQSNLGIISSIACRTDLIFTDRENHASIYDAIRLSFAKSIKYNHNDMEDLEKKLAAASPTKGKLIVTDGVFSMSGDICKLDKIVALAKKYGARVMVDDAHGFGVLGKNGRGTAEHFGLEKDVDIIMGTFSKSLASLGGYMVADKKVVEFVKHTSRPFIFSAAMTPSSTRTALEALRILKNNPERVAKLTHNARFMRGKLKEYNLPIGEDNIIPIIPIYTYTKLRTLIATKLLYENGVYVNPVLPPAAPEGECMLRTSYMSTHTEEILSKAADIINDVISNLPLEDEELMKYMDNE